MFEYIMPRGIQVAIDYKNYTTSIHKSKLVTELDFLKTQLSFFITL